MAVIFPAPHKHKKPLPGKEAAFFGSLATTGG
jgi:hypothetical protein